MTGTPEPIDLEEGFEEMIDAYLTLYNHTPSAPAVAAALRAEWQNRGALRRAALAARALLRSLNGRLRLVPLGGPRQIPTEINVDVQLLALDAALGKEG